MYIEKEKYSCQSQLILNGFNTYSMLNYHHLLLTIMYDMSSKVGSLCSSEVISHSIAKPPTAAEPFPPTKSFKSL